MRAIQTGTDSIRIGWTQSGDVTGYRIDYHSERPSSQEAIFISDGSMRDYTLTGLFEGETYNISIIAISSGNLPSEQVEISPIPIGNAQFFT